MAFDFTKLMKVADKNRQDVDGKFKTSINPPKRKSFVKFSFTFVNLVVLIYFIRVVLPF